MAVTKFSNSGITSGVKYRNFDAATPRTYPGGAQSFDDLQDLMASMVEYNTATPTAGGTLTVNSVGLGSYDYTIKRGNQTVSSFSNTDWFTTTADTRSALIAVNGNLTINSGQTFIPSNRKLFTCIYVKGDLTINGSISMTARGANHSGTTKGNVRIITGTYSGVSNPQIPSDGGAGGSAVTATNGNVNGTAGTAGTDGGAGGGGAGGARANTGSSSTTAGSGSGGTSFSGGAGGGGIWTNTTTATTAGSGTANGGAGGNGARANNTNCSCFGGAGNPDGTSVGPLSGTNADGTGGVLIIFVTGALTGTGSIVANGVQGSHYTGADLRGTSAGGSSGGGSVTILYGSDSSSITPAATGGASAPGTGSCTSGTCSGGSGGAGGNGTARKLALV
jgi:hypothetical protein